MHNKEKLSKIISFVKEHHVLTLATSLDNLVQCSSAFYVYNEKENYFIIAGDYKSEHIENVQKNSLVAVNIVLETKEIGKIEGLQVKASISLSKNSCDKDLYLKSYPYAKIMKPVLWKIQPLEMKLTQNKLGFGKKIILVIDSKD